MTEPTVSDTTDTGATYRAAGVDIDAGEAAVALMKAKVARATRPEVLGGLGGFAGLFAIDFAKYRKPLLASSTDGVGTKLVIAQALDRHDTIGHDLVGMVVDDLVVCGAEPLFMLDYIACGRVVPERIADIVGGIAEGCRLAGCALVGGETAEHPGVMDPDDYDVAGAGVGVVDADNLLGADKVVAGDVVIAMASSGLHSNGYSLARHVLFDVAKLKLDADLPELAGSGTLGEVLLTPTRIYSLDVLALAASAETHAVAHITGGGLADNLARVLPPSVDAVLDRSTWSVPPVMTLIGERGQVAQRELERTFNMGVGMVAVVARDAADAAVSLLSDRGVPAWVAGEVVAGHGQARLESSYGEG